MKILLLAIFLITSVAAQGAQWQCSEPKFTAPPEVGPDKIFRIDVYSDCLITNAKTSGLSALKDYILKEIPKESHLNGSPLSEKYEEMDSTKFDVTDSTSDPHGTLNIRSEVHLATDLVNQLILDKISTSVQGSGESGFLRRFNSSARIHSENKTYTIRYGHTMHIAKPWYAPLGKFKTEALKSVLQDFNSQRNEVVSRYTNELIY